MKFSDTTRGFLLLMLPICLVRGNVILSNIFLEGRHQLVYMFREIST